MTTQNDKEFLVYIGTYTKRETPPVGQAKWTYEGKGEGIYRYRLSLSSGALEFLGATTGVINPSFLAFHSQRRYLYAVNQAVTLGNRPGGAVSAFALDPMTGNLTFLNQQPSHGAGPCYVSVDQTDRYVLVANYRSGSIAVLPIQVDGRLGEATTTTQHQGASINPQRQEGPHAHSIVLDPTNRYVFVADLGLDKIMIYHLDLDQGKLSPNDPPWIQVKAGAGPRHFAFHPGGDYAYVINELDSTIIAFTYDKTQGMLRELQTVSTLPEGFSAKSQCADIHVHPTGRFLYGSNRGHDSIVIFAIDQGTGQLSYVGHQPTQGHIPRNFALDPTGAVLLAANQNSDTVVIFHIDPQTGRLFPTGQVVEVPTPVCVKMISFKY
jgi:6-phosphogluconolactonase